MLKKKPRKQIIVDKGPSVRTNLSKVKLCYRQAVYRDTDLSDKSSQVRETTSQVLTSSYTSHLHTPHRAIRAIVTKMTNNNPARLVIIVTLRFV